MKFLVVQSEMYDDGNPDEDQRVRGMQVKNVVPCEDERAVYVATQIWVNTTIDLNRDWDLFELVDGKYVRRGITLTVKVA